MIIVSALGRLTADPQLSAEYKCCNFSIACDSSKLKDGNAVTEFFRVSVWGKRADTAAKYLRKGSPVFVSGDLTTSEYVDRNGVNRVSKNIENASFQFAGKASAENNSSSGASALPESTGSDYSDISDSELPF